MYPFVVDRWKLVTSDGRFIATFRLENPLQGYQPRQVELSKDWIVPTT